ASQMVRATLDQVPQLDPSAIDDLQLGAGLPEGYQGGNLARVVATRLGMDTVPGATVTRFCASSIETTRTAFHAIRSGEARAVISAGVESLSFGTGRLVEDDARDPQFQPAWERTARRASREIPPPWPDPPCTTLEKFSTLYPAFLPERTATAGNCCPLSDGAAALMVMEAGYARELGITPLARIVSTGVSGLSPEIMGLGPVESTRRAL